MKEFLEFLVRQIVDDPSQVRVNEVDGEQVVVCELRVAPGEIGKVIGRRGQTAKSLRILMAIMAAKTGKKAWLEIVE